MSKQISRVVIVGGGSAGWLTAGLLAAELKSKSQLFEQFEITLIESPDVSTIGVGEGTWPSMRTTLQKIGVSETEFVRECDVSLKQGSRFNGWLHGRHEYYYHPFALPNGYSQLNLAEHWVSVSEQIPFAYAVSAQAMLCEKGLAPKSIF